MENQDLSQDLIDRKASLLDTLRFLRGAYITIAVIGVIGLATAVAYLALTPKRYEAVAQIAMAQIGATNNATNNNSGGGFNPLGINIEEPSLLIARLTQPTSFTPLVIEVCKVGEGVGPASALAKSIKLAQPKGVANLVELRTFATSPQDAHSCAQAIFGLIKATQAQIVAPYIDDARSRLADAEGRLQKVKDLLAKADKSDSAIGATYLYSRDEARLLLDEIATLKSVVISNQSRGTRLIAPIYASDTPISPKKGEVLVSGLLGGIFLGLLISLARQMIVNFKNNLGSFDQPKDSLGAKSGF